MATLVPAIHVMHRRILEIIAPVSGHDGCIIAEPTRVLLFIARHLAYPCRASSRPLQKRISKFIPAKTHFTRKIHQVLLMKKCMGALE